MEGRTLGVLLREQTVGDRQVEVGVRIQRLKNLPVLRQVGLTVNIRGESYRLRHRPPALTLAA